VKRVREGAPGICFSSLLQQVSSKYRVERQKKGDELKMIESQETIILRRAYRMFIPIIPWQAWTHICQIIYLFLFLFFNFKK
jgi:hypothetical protein